MKELSNDWKEKLKNQLQDIKPGKEAHDRMSSMKRQTETPEEIPRNARKAAVLILLKESEDTLMFPLIQRPSYDGVHSGQMAFPGGKYDQTDNDIIETALRECYEEIGIEVDRQRVIGTLSDIYIPPSNMHVVPVVADYSDTFNYNIDDYEVDKVVETSISHLQDESNHMEHMIKLPNGFNYKTPAFDVYGHTVWGATAMMLSELLMVIDKL